MSMCVAAVLLVCCPGLAAADLYRAAVLSVVKQVTADAAADKLRGERVAILAFDNRSTNEDVDSTVLQGLLMTALVQNKTYGVVERDRLDKALAEIALGAKKGITDPATRKQLGRLANADLLMTGTISDGGSGIALNAHLLDVETGEIVAAASYPEIDKTEDEGSGDGGQDEVGRAELLEYTSSEFVVKSYAMTREAARRDALRWVVEGGVFKDAQDVFEKWQQEIETRLYGRPDRCVREVRALPDGSAYVVRVNFAQVMRELVSIVFGKITPRLAVDTQEKILTRPVWDPAVQATLNAAFIRYGFQVVDSGLARKAISRTAHRQAMAGDYDALLLAHDVTGEELADIYVLGDSFAEQRADHSGFDARVEFRIVEGATARLLESGQETHGTSADDQPGVSRESLVLGKYALQRAAESLVLRTCANIVKAYGQPVHRVRVWKIGSLANRDRIAKRLKAALPGAVVTPTTLDLRGSNTAVLMVSTKKGADQIAQALEAMKAPRIKVTDIECRSVVCEIELEPLTEPSAPSL